MYSTIGKHGLFVCAAIGSTWEFAWDRFRWFFRQKTGFAWEKRLEQQNTKACSVLGGGAGGEVDNSADKKCKFFTYRPPPPHLPQGLFMRKTANELREREARTVNEEGDGSVAVLVRSVEADDSELDC